MKTYVGLYPVILDMPKRIFSGKQVLTFLRKGAQLLCLTLITTFGFHSVSSAQTETSMTTSVKNHRDISDKFREEKREVREEKRSVRAVEDIPYKTKDLFATNFAKAQDVSWSSPEDFDEADFTLKNSKMMAFYDLNSELIGTGKYISFNDLPKKAIAEIQKRYKNYLPEKVMFFDDNEANTANINMFGRDITEDSYFALMKEGSKKIVLQVLKNGNVVFFSNL